MWIGLDSVRGLSQDLIESLPLLLVSTSAAVMDDKRLRRHSQLVLVGFWPSVKLSDALTVCAIRALGRTPEHLNLAPCDVHAFNLTIPPQRPVPVTKILVDRLNGARKKLGLQIKSEFIRPPTTRTWGIPRSQSHFSLSLSLSLQLLPLPY